jgi:hypothetical protein
VVKPQFLAPLGHRSNSGGNCDPEQTDTWAVQQAGRFSPQQQREDLRELLLQSLRVLSIQRGDALESAFPYRELQGTPPQPPASQAGTTPAPKKSLGHGFNVSIRHCALRPDAPSVWYRQAAACLRAAQKSATYRSPRSPYLAALVPSVGTVILRYFKCRVWFASRCHKRPGIRALLTGPRVSSKGEAIHVRAPQ